MMLRKSLKEEQNQWTGILVYVECYKGKVMPVSLELIGEARRLAAKAGGKVYGVAIGEKPEEIREELKDSFLDEAYLWEASDEYLPIAYERIMTECINTIRPSVVLIGGTREGRALAPRIAVEFRTGLTADCTSLEIDDDGNLMQARPAFGGNIMAEILTKDRRPQLATVRPGVMPKRPGIPGKHTVFYMKKWDGPDETVTIEAVKEQSQDDSIAGQKILVAAGRGVKKKEDLEMLRELAHLLGGELACSRALVEKGWMSPSRQIGLSGSTVSPDYLITCGVSGTVQFMAGMKTAKNIIAINSDPDARIFEIAHYPVCADLYEVVPDLIERLKEGR